MLHPRRVRKRDDPSFCSVKVESSIGPPENNVKQGFLSFFLLLLDKEGKDNLPSSLKKGSVGSLVSHVW